MLDRLRNKDTREKLKKDILGALEWPRVSPAIQARSGDWSKILIEEAENRDLTGKCIEEIAKARGEDPFNIERIWRKMYSETSVYGRRGVVIHAMSAIDLALYDIMGKASGQPVYNLLGGKFRNRVKAYASTLMPDDQEKAAKEMMKWVGNGFGAVKLGWGPLGRSVDQDYAFVKSCREAVGSNVDLMVDIGYGGDRIKASKLAKKLEDLDVYFLEEPLSLDDLEGFSQLSQSVDLRIATGEKETTFFGFRDLIERGKVDVVQPDLSRAGGFTQVKRIAALAETSGTMCIPHCWSTDILVSATMHFIVNQPDIPYLEFCVWPSPIRQFIAKEPIRCIDGYVEVPGGPGLGIELNEETIRKYRVA
jgi:L-alanine-DL-glutamate epimerase-like enolase superfamily enzyme